MKKFKLVCLLSGLGLMLFTGCSSTKLANSSMIRTVGIGESSMPSEKGSFSAEFFTNNATTVDIISTVNAIDLDEPVTDLEMWGGKVRQDFKYLGFNLRFGLNDYTELKFGLFSGEINTGVRDVEVTEHTVNHDIDKTEFDTSIEGLHLGVKRLLTNYSDPTRISLYLEGKYLVPSSTKYTQKYNGSNYELKSALIFGYLHDPTFRNFPSLSLYYSLANTNRKESIAGLSANKHPQAIGVEVNVNLSYKWFYTIIYGGMEKEIVDKVTNKAEPYFGTRIGFKI